MTPEEARERMALSHSLWLLSRQIAALASAILEPVRRDSVSLWDGKASLTDEEALAGCADPQVRQFEQGRGQDWWRLD